MERSETAVTPPAAGHDAQARMDREAREAAQWQRNKPSLFVDIGLGLLFFGVAKLTDLTTAALVGAAAGLLLVLIQRFVRVDLLGGLAMFGVVMLLASAAFSLIFANEFAVKMKATVLGIAVATLMLTDAFVNRGGYFGPRMGRYLPDPVDHRRLALGMGVMALALAFINYGIAIAVPTSVWLYYTTFGDFILAMIGFFGVLRFARLEFKD
jgi:intracellular septation protein A